MNKKLSFLLLFFGLKTSPWLYSQNLKLRRNTLFFTLFFSFIAFDAFSQNCPPRISISGNGNRFFLNYDPIGTLGSEACVTNQEAFDAGVTTVTFDGVTYDLQVTTNNRLRNNASGSFTTLPSTITLETGESCVYVDGLLDVAPPDAGTDGVLCDDAFAGPTPTDAELFAVLGGTPDGGGTFSNVGQTYTYTVIHSYFPCIVDEAIVEVQECLCYPQTTAEAQTQPGMPHTNGPDCDINPTEPDPAVIIEVPVFDCENASTTPITFDTPVLPSSSSVLYHYWGNCAPNSPTMPTELPPAFNGYVQQMFCETDGFGLPAFPGGLSGENGIINFLPQESEDVGSNGFAEVGTTCLAGGGNSGADGVEHSDAELIQLDFWLAVPDNQSQVGFRFSGSRDDAASFFVGADLNEMCEVAYFKDGTGHADLPNQETGTFNINGQLTGSCGLLWMRVRVYINDLAHAFRVTPQINAGAGWVDVDQLLIEPATAADDNAVPTVTLNSVIGYSIVEGGETFFYDDAGTPVPYGCNAVPLPAGTDAGACLLVLPVDLINFDAFKEDKQIALKWQTASEENNVGFEIQKSSDGRDWEVIDWVKGNGTTTNLSNYTYLDKNPLIGDNYYRLKQVDYDGQFEFSPIVTVRYTVKNVVVEVSPNPSPGEVNVTVLNPNKEKMKIELYDSSGMLIWKSGTLSDLDIWKNQFNLTQQELYIISVQIGKEVYAEKILIIDKF